MNATPTALIVEDDPQIAEILRELVVSLDHAGIIAVTLHDVKVAIAKGGYDYVLLDMQIPVAEGAKANVGAGETALDLLRAHHPQRNAAGRHVVPIIVVTAFSQEHDFVSKMYDAGADGFLPKPFGDRIDKVLDKIRSVLARAGRGADESSTRATPPAAIAVLPITLSLDGTMIARRTLVRVNGKPREIADRYFVLVFRLALGRLRDADAWWERSELGIGRTREDASRAQKELTADLPEGTVILENDGATRLRLAAHVELAPLDWAALAKHRHPTVQKIAKERAAKA
jgi:DNA-binding response OmpR family regulator